MRPTVAEIDLEALQANYELARERSGQRDVIAVVKADAYGHGAGAVARALAAAGASRLAVLTLAEASALRAEAVLLPLLVLGGVHDAGEAAEAVAMRSTPVIHHAGQLELLAKAAASSRSPLPVHVEIDTGMRRMGVAPDEALALLERVAAESALELSGVFTHLACADEPDLDHTREQLQRFAALREEMRGRGIDPNCVHIANSAGVLAWDALAADMPESDAVRPGIMLYGANPAPHFEVELAPVMTLRTRVAQLHRAAKGDSVGYGASWHTPRATTLATLPVGYEDGLPRALGNRGVALVAGKRVPIVGRVSMDYVSVDVGDNAVSVGDEAILFGDDAMGRLSVEEVAARADTIAYEILVGIGARVPRVIRATEGPGSV